MRTLMAPAVVAIATLCSAGVLLARGSAFETGSASGVPASASDSTDVAATVLQFDAALAAGDSAAALALLADDVVVLESGGIETREEYRSHHLAADIAFARTLPSQRGPLTVRLQGDVAWATATSTTQGTYQGRQVNSTGAALMVLSRGRDGWKIRAIHWSSRSRRAPGG